MTEVINIIEKRGRGRPKGSLNKKTDEKNNNDNKRENNIEKRGRGRPKGSLNKTIDEKNNNDNKKENNGEKRGRGRPKKESKIIVLENKKWYVTKNNIVKDIILKTVVGSWNNKTEEIDFNSDYFTDDE